MFGDEDQGIAVSPEMRSCIIFLGEESLNYFLILLRGPGTKNGYEKMLFSKTQETEVPCLETLGKSHFPTDVVGTQIDHFKKQIEKKKKRNK